MQPTRFYPLLEPPLACVACGSESPRALHVFPVNHNKRRVTTQVHLALMGCERCGLVFSHPAPSEEELAAYYGGAEDGWDARITLDPVKQEQKLARKRESNERDYGLLRANVELGDARGEALDFGCGIGGWLDVLAADGWETFGIEPGANAAATAGLRHTMLESVPDRPRFGFVVVHHTLEHLDDPLATLRALAAATLPGGVLSVSVPNFGKLGEHRDFVYIAGDKHICSFTPAALESLFALAGFELVSHSNRADWNAPIEHPHANTRLAAVGRRTTTPPPLPESPLEAAVAALLAYGATRPEPRPRPPASPARRLARRVKRRLLR